MQFITTLAVAVISVLVTVLIFLIQDRSPNLHIQCNVTSDGDPSVIECSVSNTGRREARNVYIGFNKMLLLGTKVFAPPEVAAQLIESTTAPDPNLEPETASITKVFSVFIPRVPPKDHFIFQIRTIDPDNKRAAKQVLKIGKEILKRMDSFGKRLSEHHPKAAKKWAIDAIIHDRIKKENFFKPGHFSYEGGRMPIDYLTEKDMLASAIHKDYYKRYKEEFIDIFKQPPEMKAPVVRIKTEDGDRTMGIFPPWVKTYADMPPISVSALKEQGSMYLRVPVPETYD